MQGSSEVDIHGTCQTHDSHICGYGHLILHEGGLLRWYFDGIFGNRDVLIYIPACGLVFVECCAYCNARLTISFLLRHYVVRLK